MSSNWVVKESIQDVFVMFYQYILHRHIRFGAPSLPSNSGSAGSNLCRLGNWSLLISGRHAMIRGADKLRQSLLDPLRERRDHRPSIGNSNHVDSAFETCLRVCDRIHIVYVCLLHSQDKRIFKPQYMLVSERDQSVTIRFSGFPPPLPAGWHTSSASFHFPLRSTL